MRYWIPQIDNFRRSIWLKLSEGETVEETSDKHDDANEVRRYVYLDIQFESWRIFGFLDDTGFRTTAPGVGTIRRHGFHDDTQRAFYSAYFAGHGLKIRAITLPNEMLGSMFIGSWRISDASF